MNECCQNPDNLEVQDDDRPGIVVRVCRECGCRHIEMEAEPIEVGVRVESM